MIEQYKYVFTASGLERFLGLEPDEEIISIYSEPDPITLSVIVRKGGAEATDRRLGLHGDRDEENHIKRLFHG